MGCGDGTVPTDVGMGYNLPFFSPGNLTTSGGRMEPGAVSYKTTRQVNPYPTKSVRFQSFSKWHSCKLNNHRTNLQNSSGEISHPAFLVIFALFIKKCSFGASLVAQWLRVCLPMQGAWVRDPVREDPTCRGAAGPVSHGR